MMVTVKCLLGQLMVFVTGYHWIVRLQWWATWTSHSKPLGQLIECATGFTCSHWFAQLRLVGRLDISQ